MRWRDSDEMAEAAGGEVSRDLRDRQSGVLRLMIGRYTPRLVAHARAAPGHQLRRKVDPEDVVQSEYCSLVRGGGLVPGDRDGLWRVSLHRRRREAAREARPFRRKRRDVAREVALGDSPVGDGAEAPEPRDYREPSVDEAARIGEATARLLAALTATERAVIERCLRHQSTAEIARALRCSRRTVERARSRAGELLRREIASETA